MPRNSQGLYTLPPGYNPVQPDTLIEAAWANTTMDDIAQAITDSLPRNGSAPMTGQLTLSGQPPTSARHAVSKAYVDQFVAASTGMPVGSILAFAAGTVPGGFLLCDGSAVSRTTYAALFNLIGTIYGSGDGSTTFNLPNLQDQFIRGRNPATRQVGSAQASAFGSHNHPVNDPGHVHALTDPGHTHADAGHTHGVTDPGHQHSYSWAASPGPGVPPYVTNVGVASDNAPTSTNQTGVTVNSGNASIQSATTGATAANGTTGLTVGTVGDTETRPQNIALDYYIKALQDSTGPTGILNVVSTDDQAILVDESNPSVAILNINTNVAYGLVKTDGGNKIPAYLLPAGNQTLLGLFDASTGLNPSETYPSYTFNNGDTFIISNPGTIMLIDPSTGIPTATAVDAGNQLTWLVTSGTSPTQPTGWYYIIATVSSVTAAAVSFSPSGSITATDVQNGMQQLDTLKAPKNNPVFTGNVQGVTAAMVANTPAGNITATNVQAALNGLDTSKPQNNGVGATGTWNISIQGNAQTATNATNATNANVAASCTGNSATATTAAACSGNSATATMSTNVPISTNNTGTLVAGDTGKCLAVAAGQTVPASVFADGNIVSIFNDSAAPITLTQGAGLTLRLAGTATTGNLTLGSYGLATIWFRSPSVAVVSGSGVS